MNNEQLKALRLAKMDAFVRFFRNEIRKDSSFGVTADDKVLCRKTWDDIDSRTLFTAPLGA